MQRSKLVFSTAELQLACNQQVILTKNRIIGKVYERFGVLGRMLFEEAGPLQSLFPAETAVLPKISKGEQYNGFPWVMLDYPRWFNGEKGHLALRVMFLWGNYFLVQTQVSGNYLPGIYKKTTEKLLNGSFTGKEAWAGFPEDPWNFTLPQPGMVNLNESKMPGLVPNSGIFKIMEIIPLTGEQLNETALFYAGLLVEGLTIC